MLLRVKEIVDEKLRFVAHNAAYICVQPKNLQHHHLYSVEPLKKSFTELATLHIKRIELSHASVVFHQALFAFLVR